MRDPCNKGEALRWVYGGQVKRVHSYAEANSLRLFFILRIQILHGLLVGAIRA